MKKRLDVLLVERGLVESRAQAQALVLAGLVPGYDKPGHQVDEDAELVVERPPRFVSRGGEKLANALAQVEIELDGRDCVDLGASTGGFTDCLLQGGAGRVVAVDVGYGQLHERLRADGRVSVMERTNVRQLTLDAFGGLPFPVVTADLSFISLAAVLPTLLGLAAPGADVVALVKPQFEAGRAEASRGRGVIRDPAVWRRVLGEVAAALQAEDAVMMETMVSPLRGADGNVEFLLHARAHARGTSTVDLDAVVREASGDG
jgi:23S rRNA (cytidine1920-2'-O)/16S rRNA (cytidine1409-2'-O)-methyltransferase